MLCEYCEQSGCESVLLATVSTLISQYSGFPLHWKLPLVLMAQFLAQNHLLTLFLVVGLGAILGAIRVGPLRFGAAGALFFCLLLLQIPK